MQTVPFEITELKVEHLADLCAFYNENIAAVPHCYPVSEAWFGEEMQKAMGLSESPKRFVDQQVFVALEGSQITGFVHTTESVDRKGNRSCGIRFLLYPPGQRAVGYALLDKALLHLKDSPGEYVGAFAQSYRYPFYHRSAAYLSDRLGHVQALLQMRSFKRGRGEVFLDWDDYALIDPGEPSWPIEVVLTQNQYRGRLPAIKNAAMLNGEEIGECSIVSCGDYADTEEVQDRLFVALLDIEEPYQGKGLGRFLLRQTMNDAYEVGYRHAAISTAMDNSRAQVFYANYGFRVTDWTYGWELQR